MKAQERPEIPAAASIAVPVPADLAKTGGKS